MNFEPHRSVVQSGFRDRNDRAGFNRFWKSAKVSVSTNISRVESVDVGSNVTKTLERLSSSNASDLSRCTRAHIACFLSLLRKLTNSFTIDVHGLYRDSTRPVERLIA